MALRSKSTLKQTPEPVRYSAPERPPEKKPSLMPWLEKNPKWKARFERFAGWYYSSVVRGRAGQFAPSILYTTVSDVHSQPSQHAFFYDSDKCALPETFQTWFTVISLHAWLLSVRFRALPPPNGHYYLVALQSAFFKDVDLRMRDALAVSHPSKKDTMVPAPERMIKKYMTMYREQWHGLHLALDMALAKQDPTEADAELAAALWRNIFDGRGARGIHGLPEVPEDELPEFEPEEPNKDKLPAPPPTDEPNLDRYLEYPRLIWCLSRYVRQNVLRLQDVPDAEVLRGNVPKFGEIDLHIDDLIFDGPPPKQIFDAYESVAKEATGGVAKRASIQV